MAANRCAICHRRLTDPASIAMGYGPECRGKMSKRGWKFPTPKYRVHHGHVEFIGMVGKVYPPMGDTTKDERGKMKDEKREIVKRVIKNGGTPEEAEGLLADYLSEKDSPLPLRWRQWFVAKVIQEMKR